MRSSIVLDMTFTLKMFRERQLEAALEGRKLGEYFSKVISVHPLAGLFELGDERFGEPVITQLDDAHLFVEGKLGVSKSLRFLPPLNFLLAQINLIRLLMKMGRKDNVDVVRIGDPYYLGLIGLFLANRMKRPLAIRVGFRYDEIYRVTGRAVNPRLFMFRWVEKLIERFVFPRCDLIAGANEDNKNYALENAGRPDVATVFRYGNLIHDNHWLDPKLRVNADSELSNLGLTDSIFMATVARLEPMKYVESVIRVIAELTQRGHSVKGLIIGDGTLRSELEDLAVTLGVENAVIFAGNRSQEWIASVLPKATIIISPHMGRALTEAALAGVAIVAYDYDWQREIVVDGETGYLVTHKNWMGLSDKAEKILDDPDIGKIMGTKARRKALDMMNPEKLDLHEQKEFSKMFKRFSAKEDSVVKRTLVKRAIKKILPAIPGYHILCLALRKYRLQSWTWVDRIPVKAGLVVLVHSKVGDFHMSRPERCSISKKYFWTHGIRMPLEDRVALNLFANLSEQSDIILDIGANSGLFSLAAAKSNKDAEIIAFDILPEAYHVLVDNLILNHLLERVEPRLNGVGIDGEMFQTPFNNISSEMPTSLSLDSTPTGGVQVQVPIRSLDAICMPHFVGKRVCIKIDVEGTEVDIFVNAQETLKTIKPDMICEVLPDARQFELYDKILDRYSYHKYLITDKGLIAFDAIVPDTRFKDWYFTTKQHLDTETEELFE